MPIINSNIFKKKHNINPDKTLSLQEISKLSKMPLKALQEVYNKGVGAYYTNPSSVRPNVKSPEQWAYARVYSFVLKRKSTFGKADKHIAEKYNLNK
jgi:hypothetical protein